MIKIISCIQKKNIYLSICNINSTKYRNTNYDGQIIIKLMSKDISNCPIKIDINIKSEYGMCEEGNPGIANWNSLDFEDDIYLFCN